MPIDALLALSGLALAMSLAMLAWARRAARAAVSAAQAQAEASADDLFRAQEQVERYRALIEDQDDWVIRLRADGTVAFANRACLRGLGLSEAQVVGSASPFRVLEQTGGGASGETSRHYDQAIRTPSGVRWVSWIETPARGADGGPEVQRVGRDVTDRRLAEQDLAEARRKAEAASEAKSRFLATVSHEIRTPLAGVMGMADLLIDTGLNPEQTTYARAIKASGETLLSLIDEILDFSRIEAGRLELEREPFSLRPLVEGVVELLAPRAQGKGLAIESHIAADAPEIVIGDGARLRQILVNLAGNAVKFTETGGVAVTVRTSPDGLVFTVEDSGPGIPADRIGAIFDEFERIDGSAASRHSGAGLGLAISRRLALMMGGRIDVESDEGVGSRFRCVVPLPVEKQAPARNGASRRRVALLAPDGVATRAFVATIAALGHEVATFVAANAAIDALGRGRAWDVALVDAAIGEKEAREVARLVKSRTPARTVVLLSPYERRSFGAPGAAGFDGYLMKPVRLASLASVLTGQTPDSEAAPEQRCAPRQSADRAARPRVLLAEDNEVNALLATRHLERLGANVIWARGGDEALKLFEEASEGSGFDLGLLDVRMPGLDGHEVARRIRACERGQNRAPLRLVALTANVFPEDRDAALAAGFDAFMVKPVDRASLAALLADAWTVRASA